MIFCVKRLRDFLCEEVFLVKKKSSGENNSVPPVLRVFHPQVEIYIIHIHRGLRRHHIQT